MHRETNCLRPKPSIQFTVFKIFCLPWQRCTWRHRCRDVTFVRYYCWYRCFVIAVI